ncbi:hypothetical protein [Rhizobium miluonense]|uniref:DUF551 domain-containing protein n=1 Tax=Rhizobium miluonense TaxID=411945 RepID=A0ABU1SM04_9HYPH|nr:hypothetical protein [Rhizobium miluonense]MDR6900004.1 hypothetical protein [Rhizobium miluonense]
MNSAISAYLASIGGIVCAREPAEHQRLVPGFGWQRVNDEDLEHYSAKGMSRRTLHAPIPEAGNGDGWDHDMDAAPKDGTAVLVCLDAKGKDPIVCEAYFYSFDEDDKGWFLANQHPKDYTAEQIYPDAWRPLPPPPSIRSSDTGREG